MSHFQDAKKNTIVENDRVWQSGHQSITIDFHSILYLRVLLSVSDFEDSTPDLDYDNIDDQYGTCKFIEKDPETRSLLKQSAEGSAVVADNSKKDGLVNGGNNDEENECSERGGNGRKRAHKLFENVPTRQAKMKSKKIGIQISEDASVVSRTSSIPRSLYDENWYQLIPESISFLSVCDYRELCLLLEGMFNRIPKIPEVFRIEKTTPKSEILEHLQTYYDGMKQKNSRRNYFIFAFKYGSLVRYLSRRPELIHYEEQKMYLKTSYRLMKRRGKLGVRVYELFGILGEQSLKNVNANTMLYLEKITKPQFKQLIRFVKSATKKGRLDSL